MKLMRLGLAICLIASLFALAVPVTAQVTPDGAFQTDRIIVKYRDGTQSVTVQGAKTTYGDTLEGEIPQLGVKIIRVPASQISQKLSTYRADKDVLYAEPDYVVTAIDIPSDPYFSSEWGLNKINAPQAWDTSQGASSIKIAILDTGVDQNHPDLAAKIVANQDYTGSGSVDDKYGHGTHVAGIAAAITDNGVGVAGVGYDCVIMNVKVLDDTGHGYNSWIASGITWAADHGAKVINMSLSGGTASTTLQNAINYAWSKGVVVVAAAGNDGSSEPVYPAYYTNCIAVAATSQSDTKASFSNFGDWVDVAAPGVSIYSTLPNHSNVMGPTNYGSLSGTSMAAPFVAGLAGLLWATTYGTDAASVRARIESTADYISGTGSYWRYGLINAYEAVALSGSPTSPTITIASPNGGESFNAGATMTISWVSANLSGPVNIQVSRDGGDTWSTIVFNADNDGSQPWTVTAPATSQALIKVISVADASVYDTSNDDFTIVSAATSPLNLTSPNGNESFNIGANMPITWDPTGLSGYLRIELLKGSSVAMTITSVAQASAGLRNWTIPTSLVSGSDYRIRLTSRVDSSVTDMSDSYFTINGAAPPVTTTTPPTTTTTPPTTTTTAPPTTTTTTTAPPTSSTRLYVGDITTTLIPYNIIGLSFVRAMATVTVVDENGNVVPGATVYGDWSGATSDSDSGITASNGTVNMNSNLVRQQSGLSFVFTVTNIVKSGYSYNDGTPPTTTPPTASITVTSPNGGESWIVGSSHIVTWTSSGLTGEVNIQLSRDGGDNWSTIISNTANDGSQSWTVTAPATSQARIRVVSATDPGVADASNASFTIASVAAPGSVHVQGITMSLITYNISGITFVRAMATITVVDENGNVVPGATVYGDWSGATSDSDSGITASNGTVNLNSNLIRQKGTLSFTFTITNIVISGYSYDEGANLITSNTIVAT